MDGAGLYLSGRRLRDAGGEMDEDTLGAAGLGGDFDAVHEGVDASEEGGGKRGWFFRFGRCLSFEDQLPLFLVGAEQTGSVGLFHIAFIQLDHLLGDVVQAVVQLGLKLSGSFFLPESIFLPDILGFSLETFFIRNAVPQGFLQDPTDLPDHGMGERSA